VQQAAAGASQSPAGFAPTGMAQRSAAIRQSLYVLPRQATAGPLPVSTAEAAAARAGISQTPARRVTLAGAVAAAAPTPNAAGHGESAAVYAPGMDPVGGRPQRGGGYRGGVPPAAVYGEPAPGAARLYEMRELESPLGSPLMRTRMPSMAEPDETGHANRYGQADAGPRGGGDGGGVPIFSLENPVAAGSTGGRQHARGPPLVARLATAADAASVGTDDGGDADNAGEGGTVPFNGHAVGANHGGFILPRSVLASRQRLPPHARGGRPSVAPPPAAAPAAPQLDLSLRMGRGPGSTPGSASGDASRPGSIVYQVPPAAVMETSVAMDGERAIEHAPNAPPQRYGALGARAAASTLGRGGGGGGTGDYDDDDEDQDSPQHVPFFRADEGGLAASMIEGPGVYYLGVIDILQEWNWFKRLERLMKRYLMCLDHRGVSVIPPDEYAARFERRVVAEIVEHHAAATPVAPATTTAPAHQPQQAHQLPAQPGAAAAAGSAGRGVVVAGDRAGGHAAGGGALPAAGPIGRAYAPAGLSYYNHGNGTGR
jgi:hypothetical protein